MKSTSKFQVDRRNIQSVGQLTVQRSKLHGHLMSIRIRTITALAILTVSAPALLADDKAPSATECPFSYELPGEIIPIGTLRGKDRKAARLQPVVWNVDCYPVSREVTDPSRVQLTFSTCFIEPMRPHRRVCPVTNRWNGLDKIWAVTLSTDPPSTRVEYVASSSDDYFLSIKADVKSKEHGGLVKQTLSTVVKVAASVRHKPRSPSSPDRFSLATTATDTAAPDMVAFKATDGCPFDFKLPKEFAPKMESVSKGAHGRGELKSGSWSMLCSSDPESHAHLHSLLDGLSCRVEPTPPHHQICARSKRWDGTDRLTLNTIEGKTKVLYQTYNANDHWLVFLINLDKHAGHAVIENAVSLAQAVSRSVKPSR